MPVYCNVTINEATFMVSKTDLTLLTLQVSTSSDIPAGDQQRFSFFCFARNGY